MSKAKLSALGFCGADDSIHPDLMAMFSNSYPQVEFGVLLRPDRQGSPRYASPEWLKSLTKTKEKIKQNGSNVTTMRLAAHLCGSRVNDLLVGDVEYLETTIAPWFERVQINATAVNGVDTSGLAEAVPVLWDVIQRFESIEFILQRNAETEVLCQGIASRLKDKPLSNVAMLLDESKGTGVLRASKWPVPSSSLYKIGYAGGIGPKNVSSVLEDIIKAVDESESVDSFWIDMESSLRSVKNEKDIFDLDKCYDVIDKVCELELMAKPSYLQ